MDCRGVSDEDVSTGLDCTEESHPATRQQVFPSAAQKEDVNSVNIRTVRLTRVRLNVGARSNLLTEER